MINIRELVEDPTKLNAETLPELKTLVEKYPFFQVVRLLYISNLYKLHSQDFGAELRKASSFVPDRSALFALTEGVNYTLPTHGNTVDIETEDEGTRTISLIDRFLQDGGIETSEDYGPRREQPSLIDLTNDYATYLMQQDDQTSEVSEEEQSKTPKLKGADLIDSFIEENKGKQRVDIPETDNNEFTSPEFSDEEEEIYTENMVNIYIKQGRYQQALEILRKISLNNPKKSSNFAAQIYLLEILLKQNQ
jgi:hypothetical protein